MPKNPNAPPAFELFGSEVRTRVAMAFVPSPGVPVSAYEVGLAAGSPGTSLSYPLGQLVRNGLLIESGRENSEPITYARTDHPLWAVYESAKVALQEMNVRVQSIVDSPEPRL